MASNTTLNTGAGGDIIATKERTHDGDATKVQVVTLAGVTGTEGSYTFTDVTAGGGVEATALRVTIASDSTGVVSVDDNGGSLTVDGTVELGAASLAALETIELGATSLAALESLTTINAVTSITNAVTVVGSAAEDAAASGNPVLIGGRYDSSARTLETGDVGALALNASGQLLVEIAAGAGSGGTSAADGATFTRNTTSITPAGAVVESSAPTLTNGDVAGLSQDTSGRLRVRVDAGGVAGQVDDAAFTAGTTEGVAVMGYYNSTRDAIDSGDAGAVALNSRRAQYIAADGVVSTANSTTANLAGAAVFTGTSEEVTDYALIQVSVFSSHASATDGLSLQQSSNGTNWDITDTFTIAATTPKVISLQPAAQYFRLVYTNGGTLTTSLRIQVIFKPFASKGSSQRPGDATSNENDFEMVSGFLHGFNGTTWDRLRTTGTGLLNVVLTASTATQEIVGDAATDAAVSGNPVYIAGRGNSGTPTAMSANNDVTPLWLTLNGAAVVAGDIVDDAAFTPGTSRVQAVGYTADEASTDSVDEGDIGAARMTLDRKQIVTPYAHAGAGGHTPYKNLDVDESEDEVKGSGGKVFWLHAINLANAKRYLKIYNNTAAGTTVGTTVPDLTFPLPTMGDTNGAGFTIHFGDHGIALGTGITIAATTGFADNDTGAPGANEVIVNLGYL